MFAFFSNILQLRLKPNNSRFIEVLLTKPLEAPMDILVSVRLSNIMGRMRNVRSITKFYIYTTEGITGFAKPQTHNTTHQDQPHRPNYKWRGY